MKIVVTAATIACLVVHAVAGISIPRSVFRIEQLAEAQAEAEKDGKGLAFLLTEPDTTCGLCIASSEEALKRLKSHSTIVLVNVMAGDRWEKVSPMVVTGFSEPKMGDFFPKVVVTSPAMSEIWGQMRYDEMKKDANFSALKKQVDSILKGTTRPENRANQVIYWPVRGIAATYDGSFESLNDDGTITLKMQKNGNIQKIRLERLSEPCAAFARMLANQTIGDAAKTNGAADTFEAWTGSNGTTLQAKFVSLENDRITLEMEDGKKHTLPLDRLDAASQEKARKRASDTP